MLTKNEMHEINEFRLNRKFQNALIRNENRSHSKEYPVVANKTDKLSAGDGEKFQHIPDKLNDQRQYLIWFQYFLFICSIQTIINGRKMYKIVASGVATRYHL